MSPSTTKAVGSGGPLADLRFLYLLLVILPLGVSGICGHLVRNFNARNLAVLEAGRMAQAGLAIGARRGPEEALRTLEGVVGYELAFYRDGVRTSSTDPGFGPDTLDRAARLLPDPDAGELTMELDGRLGALAGGLEGAALAAPSVERTPGHTYPGGLAAVSTLALALLLAGLGVLSVEPGPTTARAALVAAVPLAISWVLLVGAVRGVSFDAESASARRVGLAAALARDAGLPAPLDYLAQLSGLDVARIADGKVAEVTEGASDLRSQMEDLPRPPMGRTTTGYLSGGGRKLRYSATRASGETLLFLAPAPALPPPGPALQLFLLGLGVTGSAAAFVVLSRRSARELGEPIS